MKKMKKVLIAALACILVCGISVPVIAANMQKTSARVEPEVHTRNAGLCNVILSSGMISSNSIENSVEIQSSDEGALQDVPETEEAVDIVGNEEVTDEVAANGMDDVDVPAGIPEDEGEPADSANVTDTGVADTAASPVCPYHVDANGDGVCDHCAHGGSCSNYVDYNGDGVCDYCAHGGSCGNYVDANGDGVCDYCTHSGSGHCGSYVDSNGDGVCDNYTGGGNGSGGGSGHHGSHHGGGHH